MNEHRYKIVMFHDRPAPPALCERRGVNAQHAREQPREVEVEPARKEPTHAHD